MTSETDTPGKVLCAVYEILPKNVKTGFRFFDSNIFMIRLQGHKDRASALSFKNQPGDFKEDKYRIMTVRVEQISPKHVI